MRGRWEGCERGVRGVRGGGVLEGGGRDEGGERGVRGVRGRWEG